MIGSYLVVDSPYELARWRPLVNWVLVIPHTIVLYGLQILAQVVFVVYWVMLIFTGTLNPSLYGVLVMYERYNTRANGFLFGYSERIRRSTSTRAPTATMPIRRSGSASRRCRRRSRARRR